MIKQSKLQSMSECTQTLVIPFTNSDDLSGAIPQAILDLVDSDFAKVTSVNTLGLLKAPKVVFIGLGDSENLNLAKISQAIKAPIHALDDTSFTVNLQFIANEDNASQLASVVTLAIHEARYTFKDEKPYLAELLLNQNVLEEIEQANILAESVKNARDLVNMPSNKMTSLDLEAHCQTLADELNFDFTSYDNQALEQMGAGGILAVNQGSSNPARLLVLKYEGKPGAEYTALVGKGITFDTGGYNLKPSASMTTMKTDMGGAAAVISAFEALVRLKANVNLYAICAVTDNMISGNSFKVDDVITMMNGKTVEITNTDAEGRLVLADALTHASRLGATSIIDVATLTGACVAALGSEFTGVFTNDDELLQNLRNASERALEPIWQLPLSDAISKSLSETIVADLVNSTGKPPGASVAAAFLKEFVEPNIKWAHLDIAGTSFLKARKDAQLGATGVMVKTLVEYFLS